MPDVDAYPATSAARDRFVVERRGVRVSHDPWRHQGVLVEDERTAEGTCAPMATVFITGRECPWRCAMCDLWQYTTVGDTPVGAVAAQVASARAAVLTGASEPIAGMKLYNAGSFFDARAVPEADYDAIASTLSGLSRVVVESHPTLVLRAGARVDRFLAALARQDDAGGRPPQLEVAMGLETAHPDALDRLNKRFTVSQFARAAAALATRGVALRVFLLIAPPFVADDEQLVWLRRSLDVALDCGAAVVSLVPTRGGNGAMEALAAAGSFRPPSLEEIERSVDVAMMHARGRARVFVDLWNLERFARCSRCLPLRHDRLHAMNLAQRVLAPVACDA